MCILYSRERGQLHSGQYLHQCFSQEPRSPHTKFTRSTSEAQTNTCVKGPGFWHTCRDSSTTDVFHALSSYGQVPCTQAPGPLLCNRARGGQGLPHRGSEPSCETSALQSTTWSFWFPHPSMELTVSTHSGSVRLARDPAYKTGAK